MPFIVRKFAPMLRDFNMQAAASEYGWELNLGEIAQIWRGGCIIRAAYKNTEAMKKI